MTARTLFSVTKVENVFKIKYTIFKFPSRKCSSTLNASENMGTCPNSVLSRDKSRTRSKSFEDIPGPKGMYTIPFLGTALTFKPFGPYSRDTYHHLLQDLHSKYGDIVRLRLGHKWMVFLFNPLDIQTVFYQDERFPYRATSALMTCYSKRKGVELGLAFQNGQKWSELRRPVQDQLLRPTSVDRYIPLLGEIADDFISWAGEKGSFSNVNSDVTRLCMEYSGMLCFDKRLGFMDNSTEIDDFAKSFEIILESLGQSFDGFPWYKLYPTRFYREFEKSYDYIRSTSERWLKEETTDGHNTFLSAMMTDVRIPRNNLLSVLNDLFLAGVDATGNLLTFALYHLAKNVDVQEKLFNDIMAVQTQSSTLQHTLQELPYLKACVKETLRLVPPVQDGNRRILDKDMIIAGYEVPNGTDLVLCNSIIGNCPKYFRDYDVYRPERWLRDGIERATIPPFAVLPFGFGPRKCVGQRFAELQMHISILKLVEKYRLVLDPGDVIVQEKYRLFATPSCTFSIRLEKRT